MHDQHASRERRLDRDTSRRTPNARAVFPVVVLGVLFFLIIAPAQAHGTPPDSALIVHSYGQEYPWTKRQHEGFMRRINAEKPDALAVSVESLDTKRVPYTPAYADMFAGYLGSKYEARPPDVIYVTDDNAMSFALSHLETLFPDAAIFFSGVNETQVKARLDPDRTTGVFERKEIGPNLDLMRRLAPNVRDIVFVGDDSETDHAIRREAEVALEAYPEIHATFLSNKHIEPLLEELRGRPERFVFLTTIGGFKDATGRTLSLAESTSAIADAAPFVIFSMEDVYLQPGVLGGWVTSGTRQGEAAADMVVRHLDGVDVADIAPLETSPNEYVFDGGELKRDALVLPPDIAERALILHPTLTFFQRRLDLILKTLYALLAVFVLSVVVCLIALIRKHRQLLESHRREADARRTAERLSTFGKILDSSANEIFIFDAETLRFLHVNHGGRANLGYTMDEMREMTPLDIKPDQTPEEFAATIAPLRDGTRSTVRFTTRHLRKDGSSYPVEVNLQRSEIDGSPVFVAVILDITERRQIEEALRESREEAVAANRAKSAFLANMSHEIRTPMTAILGHADLLADSVQQPEEREGVRIIRRNGDHLLGIINDILDLSKIEAGMLQVESLPTSPATIFNEAASLMKLPAEAKNLALTLEYAGPLPKTVHTDPVRLRQIVVNLLSNAVKFTEQGEVKLVVRFLDQDGPPRIQCEVIDTGIGLTPDQLERVFQPFQQADCSTTRNFGGTGLGLAISKRLAIQLGGDITVVSAPGQGSTFTITVATGPVDGVPFVDQPAEATAWTAAPNGGAATRLHCRILLAEDGLDNQRLISLMLRKAGAEVEIVENGQEAMEAALAYRRDPDGSTAPFDVILMDMQMPVMDGYEATRRLRAEGYAGPILAVTAHAMKDDMRKCLDAGCSDYLTKPITRETFLAAVAKHAGTSLLDSRSAE